MLEFKLPEGEARSLWFYYSEHGVLQLRTGFPFPSSLRKGPLKRYGTLQLRLSPTDWIVDYSNRIAKAEGCPILDVRGSSRN